MLAVGICPCLVHRCQLRAVMSAGRCRACCQQTAPAVLGRCAVIRAQSEKLVLHQPAPQRRCMLHHRQTLKLQLSQPYSLNYVSRAALLWQLLLGGCQGRAQLVACLPQAAVSSTFL